MGDGGSRARPRAQLSQGPCSRGTPGASRDGACIGVKASCLRSAYRAVAPRPPAISHAAPRGTPSLRLWTGHPALPPSPHPRRASHLGQPGGEPALSNPGQKETHRSPWGGDFIKPIAPGGRAAPRSGRCHTRQQSSHSAECQTTDGDMQRDTGSVRQTNSPT